MKKAILFSALITALSLPATSAVALSDDMLDDLHTTHNRPWVPSDARRGQEMIQTVPHIFTQNKDMFDSVRLTPVSWNEDMIKVRKMRTYAYGSPIFTYDK